MADKIVTLHPQNNKSDNLYPRVLGQSVRAGTNIAIDSTANTISVAQSLVDTINGKQTKGDYATNSTLTNNYYTKSNVDSLLATKQAVGNYALKSDIPTKTSQLTNNSGYLISSDLKTSVSVVSNSDDTTSLKVSVGGVSSSVKTDTLKVGYANTAKQADNALSANHSVTSGLATNAVQLVKSSNAGTYYTYESLNNALNSKQNKLVSGTNLKTINGNSLLGSGNIGIAGNVTIGYVDIINNISNTDDGTFWSAFTGHKAILGVYRYHSNHISGEDYYYEEFESCVCDFGVDDVDPGNTRYVADFYYYGKTSSGTWELTPVPTGATIRIVYID